MLTVQRVQYLGRRGCFRVYVNMHMPRIRLLDHVALRKTFRYSAKSVAPAFCPSFRKLLDILPFIAIQTVALLAPRDEEALPIPVYIISG